MKSVSQANFYSKLFENVTADGISIVRRLASRSFMGQVPHNRIHQHFGFKLYLVWLVNDHGDYNSMRCIESVHNGWEPSRLLR